MSELQKKLQKGRLPPLPEKHNQSRFSGLVPKRRIKDYSPVEWNEYFDVCEDVKVGDNSFRVYSTGKSGPVLLLLHGCGHSALSMAVFAKSISGLCECQAVAIDFRGHGHTTTTDDLNLDANILAHDMADALKSFIQDLPPVVILGHSMGGAIAVHIGVKKLLPTLKGVAVIDVVEGTALDALSSMGSFIRGRPSSFKSLENAIEWSVRSGQLKNLESARVSMPGQLDRITKTFSMDAPEINNVETDEHKESEKKTAVTEEECCYTWRVDLAKTEPHWRGWFENMSSLFLSCPCAKLLILAGVDRLDKELTIAQMQGKFQMTVLSNCGHMVHEDKPESVAEIVTGFLVRQKLTHQNPGIKRHMPAC